MSYISNDIFFYQIYDKYDDYDFEIMNSPFLDGDVSFDFIFLNPFDLLDHQATLLTSTLVINC